MTHDPRLAELLRRARDDRPPLVDVQDAVLATLAARPHPAPVTLHTRLGLALPANGPVLVTVAASLLVALTAGVLAWPAIASLSDPLGGVFSLTELGLP